MAVVVLTGLVLAPALNTGVQAAMDLGPYRAIIDRNIFNTLPPPPPAPPAPPPAAALPTVKLVGLTKIGGKEKAVIWSQEPGAPPKQPVTALMVAGQRDGEITLLEIDLRGKSAKVQIRNDITTLALEDKPVGGGPAAPQPGAGGIPRPRPPNIGPAARGAAPSAFNAPPVPTYRNPAAANTMPGGYNNNNGVPTATADTSGDIGQTLPTRQVRTDTTEETQMTPEQQMILIEAQRDAMLRSGNPAASILPPTQLGNLMNQQSGGVPNPAAH